MSWIFGINKGQQGGVDLPTFPGTPGSGGDGGDDKSNDRQGQNKAMEAYRFDSAALERAARAAKELEKSRKLLELATLSTKLEINVTLNVFASRRSFLVFNARRVSLVSNYSRPRSVRPRYDLPHFPPPYIR